MTNWEVFPSTVDNISDVDLFNFHLFLPYYIKSWHISESMSRAITFFHFSIIFAFKNVFSDLCFSLIINYCQVLMLKVITMTHLRAANADFTEEQQDHEEDMTEEAWE